MKEEKFNLTFHPVDYCNAFFSFEKIFDNDKTAFIRSTTEVSYPNPEDLQDDMNKPTYVYSEQTGKISVMKANPHRITPGEIISKFHLLTHVKFKGNIHSCESFILYKIMGLEIPYARIGTDYYFIEDKPVRWGTNRTISIWKKAEIVEDHSKAALKIIPKYNGFCLEPDNLNYSPTHGKYYNLYSSFPHTPAKEPVSISEIPHTINLIRHIFGEQFNQGLKYMKVIYENPKQILPILSMVSKERETGKTTVIDWFQMLFGENCVLIKPSNLTSDFNLSFATKNIVLVDEAFLEKNSGIEKLKSITTAKNMLVNPKHANEYSIPFYGKVILCSNKEIDFAKIDVEEIRFWVRKLKPITGKKNVNILQNLFNEIPKFLRYLLQMPVIDYENLDSRMVFTAEEIGTHELLKVKQDSRQVFIKDIEIRIRELFFEKPTEDVLYATSVNIYDRWFKNNSYASPSLIKKLLQEEFKLDEPKQKRYFPFGEGSKVMNRPFEFKRSSFLSEQEINEVISEKEEF